MVSSKLKILLLFVGLLFSISLIKAQKIIAPPDIIANSTIPVEKLIVPIQKVSSNKVIHRFHDTSPLSPSGKFLALFRVPLESRYPKPGDWGEVILVEITTLKERVLAKSFGWELQVGANVQWGATDNELFFNNVDTTTWESYTVKLDPFSGNQERINGPLFMVSQDGKFLVSHNLRNSIHAQSGYGVIIPEKLTQKNVGPVDSDGIFVTNVENGVSKKIASIKDIYEKAFPEVTVPSPENFAFYCFKAMWNPQRTRIMTCLMLKPLDGSRRKVAVITMRPDGTEIKTAITHEQYAKGGHHMAWMPDGEHISMNLENDGKPGLEIISVKYDGSNLKTVFPVGSGHPSFHPGGLPYIITDSYSHEPVVEYDNFVPIRLLNSETNEETIIAYVYVPKVDDSSFRVDPHPAWDRSGRYVIFNGFEDNTRCVFIADLTKLLKVDDR
jgi:hypothetical protein